MKVGAIERKALVYLRVSGPCSVASLSQESGVDRRKMYGAVYRLREKKLAIRLGEARYDITRRGRRLFTELFAEQDPGLWAFAENPGR